MWILPLPVPSFVSSELPGPCRTGGQSSGQLHIARYRAQRKRLPRAAAGLDAAGDRLQPRLGAQRRRQDLAAYGLQRGLVGMAGELDIAAHTAHLQRRGACVDAGVAADRIDLDVAADEAVDHQRRTDHVDIQRGGPWHVHLQRTGRHLVVAAEVEPARAAARLDLDDQVIVVAGDLERFGAFTQLATDLDLVTVPRGHVDRAGDVADADLRSRAGGVLQLDRGVLRQRTADTQAEQQWKVEGGFHGDSHVHQLGRSASWRSCACCRSVRRSRRCNVAESGACWVASSSSMRAASSSMAAPAKRGSAGFQVDVAVLFASPVGACSQLRLQWKCWS